MVWYGMVWYVENSLLSSNTERQLLVALQAAGNGLWLPLERAESPSHSCTYKPGSVWFETLLG